MIKSLCIASMATVLACSSPSKDVECSRDSNCNLEADGQCQAACSGRKWCSYPDTDCSSGTRWSDFDTGDGLSGNCLKAADLCPTVDAGPPDASLIDAGNVDCEEGILFAGEIDNPNSNFDIFRVKPDGATTNLTNLAEQTDFRFGQRTAAGSPGKANAMGTRRSTR